jgi:plasmid stabilization system protein ParE
MRIEWSAAAVADLDRFRAFLRERHPTLADTVGRSLRQRVSALSYFPLLGRPLLQRPEYRELLVTALNAAYAVQYRIDDEVVTILRVFHGREQRGDRD